MILLRQGFIQNLYHSKVQWALKLHTMTLQRHLSYHNLKKKLMNGSAYSQTLSACNTAHTHRQAILRTATTAPSHKVICTELHSITWAYLVTSQFPWETPCIARYNSALITRLQSAHQAAPSLKSRKKISVGHFGPEERQLFLKNPFLALIYIINCYLY